MTDTLKIRGEPSDSARQVPDKERDVGKQTRTGTDKQRKRRNIWRSGRVRLVSTSSIAIDRPTRRVVVESTSTSRCRNPTTPHSPPPSRCGAFFRLRRGTRRHFNMTPFAPPAFTDARIPCGTCTLITRVPSLLFFSLSGDGYLSDGVTDRREILHDGTYRSRTNLLPFWKRCPGDPPNPKF